MAYLAESACVSDLELLRAQSPDLWRRVRRFNLPVQLALAAGENAMSRARKPAEVALVSVAPCQGGSLELYRWGYSMVEQEGFPHRRVARINPTHTLHAVDNLALSSIAIAHSNHAYCLGLGGSAGQAWCGLETVLEVFAEQPADEVLLMAGDQDSIHTREGVGVALLFSRHRRPWNKRENGWRLVEVRRRLFARPPQVEPHSALGLRALLEALESASAELEVNFTVSPEQTDGLEAVSVVLERV